MKNKLIYPLIATVLLIGAACRGDRNAAVSQKEYEAVQEGSAAGVTSTIHGPGETIPPLTGTNSDTTTAFSLNTTPGQPAAGQPGTIAGTMPAQPYPSTIPTGTYVPPAPPVTRQPIVITRSRQPVPQQPVPVQPVPEPQPPTETTEPVPPPSQTDTTATQPPPPSPTAPPPAEKPKEQKPPVEQEEDEQTDTAEPPPPPPPPPPSGQRAVGSGQ